MLLLSSLGASENFDGFSAPDFAELFRCATLLLPGLSVGVLTFIPGMIGGLIIVWPLTTDVGLAGGGISEIDDARLFLADAKGSTLFGGIARSWIALASSGADEGRSTIEGDVKTSSRSLRNRAKGSEEDGLWFKDIISSRALVKKGDLLSGLSMFPISENSRGAKRSFEGIGKVSDRQLLSLDLKTEIAGAGGCSAPSYGLLAKYTA